MGINGDSVRVIGGTWVVIRMGVLSPFIQPINQNLQFNLTLPSRSNSVSYLSSDDYLAVCAWMGIQFLLINWVR